MGAHACSLLRLLTRKSVEEQNEHKGQSEIFLQRGGSLRWGGKVLDRFREPGEASSERGLDRAEVAERARMRSQNARFFLSLSMRSLAASNCEHGNNHQVKPKHMQNGKRIGARKPIVPVAAR